MKSFLPDVNVWIALVFDSHLHHQQALDWLTQCSQTELFFCRTTQQGFLRVASNRKAMGDDVMTLPDAWQAYDTILSDPKVSFFDEPINLDAHWRSFTMSASFSPNIWTDAYLAAFACAADLQIVTFDRGFARYKNLSVRCLSL